MNTEPRTALTAEQIRARIKALDMYEQSLLFSMPDEGELTTREMMRVVMTRSALKKMLAETGAA